MKCLLFIVFIGFVFSQSKKHSDYLETIEGSKLQIQMIYLLGGEFQMGSSPKKRGSKNDEHPNHRVFLSPFWIASYETTWEVYELFLNKVNQARKDGRGGVDLNIDGVSSATMPYVNYNQDGFPAINITQYAASQFCKWLTAKTGNYYRLPTEAEWEYACRSGSGDAFSFGDKSNNIDKYAWHKDNSGGVLQKVGLKNPNLYGIYDMHGNAAEWVLDSYDPTAYIERSMIVKNPIVLHKDLYPRVVRGGSYKDSAHMLRSSSRGFSSPSWKKRDPQVPKSLWWHTDAKHVGFRIVRPLQGPDKKHLNKYWVKPKKEY